MLFRLLKHVGKFSSVVFCGYFPQLLSFATMIIVHQGWQSALHCIDFLYCKLSNGKDETSLKRGWYVGRVPDETIALVIYTQSNLHARGGKGNFSLSYLLTFDKMSDPWHICTYFRVANKQLLVCGFHFFSVWQFFLCRPIYVHVTSWCERYHDTAKRIYLGHVGVFGRVEDRLQQLVKRLPGRALVPLCLLRDKCSAVQCDWFYRYALGHRIKAIV